MKRGAGGAAPAKSPLPGGEGVGGGAFQDHSSICFLFLYFLE